jgi:hypothetical protein
MFLLFFPQNRGIFPQEPAIPPDNAENPSALTITQNKVDTENGQAGKSLDRPDSFLPPASARSANRPGEP